MKKLFAKLTGICIGAAVITGCGSESSETAKVDDGKIVIGMSQCNLGEPWRVQMNADIKKAADTAGIK